MNYNIINCSNGKEIRMWTKYAPVEENAIKQLMGVAELDCVGPAVCAMPDVHVGKGATVGSVIPFIGGVVPAAVGVDICCTISFAKISATRESLVGKEWEIYEELRKKIPNGRTNNGGIGDRGAWANIPEWVQLVWDMELSNGYNKLSKIRGLISKHTNSINHLGTLGGGNHFCSISTDENNDLWIMVHSGSRGIGARIGNHFMDIAKNIHKEHLNKLPSKDLAWIPSNTEDYENYLFCTEWCNRFARLSGGIMLNSAVKVLSSFIGSPVTIDKYHTCHHNFIKKEVHNGIEYDMVRKGAVSASTGEICIIPGAMGKRSFVVEGLGNPDSFMSCSHGGGRIMTRTKAREVITIEDHAKDTEGVFCGKDKSVVEESPAAYKNIDDVMRSQEDLVNIRHTLKEFINIKGVEEENRR